MYQKSPIWAPIIDGVQYPLKEVKVELFGAPAESPHTEVNVAEGIYACGYNSEGGFMGVRRLIPENNDEIALFKEKKLDAITEIYLKSLRFNPEF